MCARGSTSQSTRNASSTKSCIVRTATRPRRSRLSHSRYCKLGFASAAASTFDMDLELLPERVEVPVEFRRVARREWSRTAAVRTGEADRMVRFELPRPARQHDHPLGHADRLSDVM